MKAKILMITLVLLPLALLFGCARSAAPAPHTIENVPVERGENGAVLLRVSAARVAQAGIRPGDSVDVVFSDAFRLNGAAFLSGEYAPQGCPSAVQNGDVLVLSPNGGGDLWATAGLQAGDAVTLRLRRSGDFAYLERERALYAEVAASYGENGGFAFPSFEARGGAAFTVTEFTETPGRYGADGSLSAEGVHGQLIPVSGGRMYYLGFRDPEDPVPGAFFSVGGKWIAPLTAEDVEGYDYNVPNGIPGTWRMEGGSGGYYEYLRLYRFTAPPGAAYVSLNLNQKPQYAYRRFLASMPVYLISGVGNCVWSDADPVYRASADKRLCVIGQSPVMIDRLLRPTDPGDPDCPERYIAGFQEYLAPWYAEVRTYGYSGRGYMRTGSDGIYDYMISGGVDISGYDAYMFSAGSNNLKRSNIGAYDSRDPATYCGVINIFIDRIRAGNPGAEIYVCGNFYRSGAFASEKTRALVDAHNAMLSQLAAYRDAVFLDPNRALGMTKALNDMWTYDGAHPNQPGSYEIGMYYRRMLLGF